LDLPNIIEESLEVDVGEEEVRKKKKVTFKDKVDEWNLQTFAKYFEYLYQHKFSKPYIPKKGDLKQLKRILDIKDKETVKYYMETFMDLDFFSTKTLRIFCSNYTQTVLDSYDSTGKLPNHKKVKNEPEVTTEWEQQLKDIGWD
jgi:hypothetical protein